MTNTFEVFKTNYLGCFNIGTCIHLFNTIISQNDKLTDKQKKELLDDFGVALKGKKTSTIRKSLDRMSHYSASSSTKSQSRLNRQEREEASKRLSSFLKNRERDWAVDPAAKELFLFFLTDVLEKDPNYRIPSKRFVKKHLKSQTRLFYHGQNQEYTIDYYSLLEGYFLELLDNPNRYNFKEKYTLYENCHLLATLAAEKQDYPDPIQALNDWQSLITKRYQELHYQLVANQLDVNDLTFLIKKY